MAAEIDPAVDHIHAHFLHTPGSVARYAATMLDLRFSISGHAKDVWTTPDWELREKLRDAAWTVTCSDAAAARLRALAPGRPLERLYHGLDHARWPAFDRPAAMRDGTNPDDPVHLVSVCRAVEKKGLDTLLDALARLPADVHWRLTHVGGGPDLPALRRQAARLGIACRIDWRGAAPQADVLAALRSADLFALAPRVAGSGDRDGLPNVLMEAQSQGLSVVATPITAVPEIVSDGETGLLVPPDDAAALAHALARLIRMPTLRDTFGAEGARRVRAQFDSDAWLDRLAARFQKPRMTRDETGAKAA
jgi:glycosyltransferase involved in cell wall biosynthesis